MHWGERRCEDHVPMAPGQAKQASAKVVSDGSVAWWASTTGQRSTGDERRTEEMLDGDRVDGR
ncbi:hypothetical protein E2562_025877 [Oryza meyeriana var. granulata]|uniref:Uncharacterized protein n=1 Tax=Oryza meyeriana var. granulata TaxID=110450 RepID=A0A6G1D7X2_9ORYZ|nr:hypothetical protein E2562_025877 [Oryza meyeriana var. granulata]